MKIPNKREFQQIAVDHLPDIDFTDFMNNYKRCIANPYWVLVIDAILHQIIPYVLGRIF